MGISREQINNFHTYFQGIIIIITAPVEQWMKNSDYDKKKDWNLTLSIKIKKLLFSNIKTISN